MLELKKVDLVLGVELENGDESTLRISNVEEGLSEEFLRYIANALIDIVQVKKKNITKLLSIDTVYTQAKSCPVTPPITPVA